WTLSIAYGSVLLVLGIIGFSIQGGNEPYTYTWLKDNVVIGNGTTIVVTPVSGSTYSLSVTDKNGCVVSHSLNVSTIKKVSNSGPNTLKVRIFPTIVSKQINIELKDFIPQNCLLKIFDMNGNIHYTQQLSESTTIYPTLSTGTYFLVIDAAGKYFVEKIVVNN
ncbi:MAG: T9SS type A sorting domain-containing protein, partial [Paludibacter sp.]